MNKILAAWAWNGPVSEPIAYGEGHINQTYALTEQATQKRYILQKINTDTFKDPDGLMENICGVTDFLREKAKQRGVDPERATLHVALTKAGKPYYKAADGGCWRVYDFVENTVCLQQVQSAEDFYQSAVAFGNFQHQLADYPANTLHETIPHFHDTPKRFADFQRAVAEDRMGRAAQVQREIEFVRGGPADSGQTAVARHPQRHQAEQYPVRQNDWGGAVCYRPRHCHAGAGRERFWRFNPFWR